MKVQHLTFYTQIAEKILKISNFFPCFQNFMENLQNVIKIGRAGGRQHIKSTREGWNLCFSLLYTAIPSPYVFQTINLAVMNTSCFLGTDICKQQHCRLAAAFYKDFVVIPRRSMSTYVFFFLFILQGYMSRNLTFYCYSISGDDLE